MQGCAGPAVGGRWTCGRCCNPYFLKLPLQLRPRLGAVAASAAAAVFFVAVVSWPTLRWFKAQELKDKAQELDDKAQELKEKEKSLAALEARGRWPRDA